MMFNKKGQTLALFIILIPLILAMMAFVVDMGLIIIKKVEMKEIAKTTLKEVLSSDEITEESVKELLVKNEMDIKKLEIEIDNNEIHLVNLINIDSIFGAIIGLKNYEIKLDIKGYVLEGKIIIE